MLAVAEPLKRSKTGLQIELVDSNHVEWSRVLELADELNQRQSLHLAEDGWLSARQQVFAAFMDGQPSGLLCFHVYPVGPFNVEARLDALSVLPEVARSGLSHALVSTAKEHARQLRCGSIQGLGLRAA